MNGGGEGVDEEGLDGKQGGAWTVIREKRKQKKNNKKKEKNKP